MKDHLERDIEAEFCKQLDRLGVVHHKLSVFRGRGTTGWPDQLVIVPEPVSLLGRPDIHFVELKRINEDPTPLQSKVHDMLRFCGCQLWVARGMDEALAWVRMLQRVHGL